MAAKTATFRPEKFDWYRYAVLGGPFADTLTRAIGFLQAGDALVDLARKDHVADRLFYPASFCYRYFAEELLKHLIAQIREYIEVLRSAGQTIEFDQRTLKGDSGRELDLKQLAQSLRRAFEAATSERFDEATLATLVGLQEIKPLKRQARRKATGQGKMVASTDETVYDLEDVKEQMRSASAFLLGMVKWLDAQSELAQRYLATLKPRTPRPKVNVNHPVRPRRRSRSSARRSTPPVN